MIVGEVRRNYDGQIQDLRFSSSMSHDVMFRFHFSSATAGEEPESIIFEGQKFKTFEELEEAVCRFEYLTYHKYFKAEARTLQSAMRKGIKRVEDNGKFKYYSCLWLCVRGGKPFCRSRGERKSKLVLSSYGRHFQVSFEHGLALNEGAN